MHIHIYTDIDSKIAFVTSSRVDYYETDCRERSHWINCRAIFAQCHARIGSCVVFHNADEFDRMMIMCSDRFYARNRFYRRRWHVKSNQTNNFLAVRIVFFFGVRLRLFPVRFGDDPRKEIQINSTICMAAMLATKRKPVAFSSQLIDHETTHGRTDDYRSWKFESSQLYSSAACLFNRNDWHSINNL